MLIIDYKIFATMLTTHLKVVLLTIIADSQTGFMAGRQISTNIRKAIDICDLVQKCKMPGHLILIDFMKCFDMIEYSGIVGSLHYFGIGKDFIAMVQLLLTNFQACVTNNGHMSEWFEVTHSCHQGCPIAPSLMIICAEAMSHTFKQNLLITPFEFQTCN